MTNAADKNSAHDSSVYDDFVKLTCRYFGEDAPEDLRKLLAVHLQKPPELTTSEELVGLLDWIYSAVAFLEEDQAIIKRYLLDVYQLCQ